MKPSPRILIIIAIAVVVAVFGYYLTLDRSNREPVISSPSVVEVAAFTGALQDGALQRVGQPIEGFNAIIYREAFPGLQEQDFNGVETREGIYVYSQGVLGFQRTRNDVITSAERAISQEGHATLLHNVRKRLGEELTVPEIMERLEASRAVTLFYYNPARDSDENGDILCSRQGLVRVERKIAVTQTPIQDTVRLLITGGLTNAERIQGVQTEFPLEGFALKGANLADGVLMLEFADSNNKTVGGACRATILWFQIEATAKQFADVEEVRFIPKDLFQP